MCNKCPMKCIRCNEYVYESKMCKGIKLCLECLKALGEEVKELEKLSVSDRFVDLS